MFSLFTVFIERMTFIIIRGLPLVLEGTFGSEMTYFTTLKHLKGILPLYLPEPFFILLTNFASATSISESTSLSALKEAYLVVDISLPILIS